MNERKLLDLKEFMDFGYLQEVNRQFFHPLGLALMVMIDENENLSLGGIWDVRDDPEGMAFAEGELEPQKYLNVNNAQREKALIRLENLGWVVQPPPNSRNPFEEA